MTGLSKPIKQADEVESLGSHGGKGATPINTEWGRQVQNAVWINWDWGDGVRYVYYTSACPCVCVYVCILTCMYFPNLSTEIT